MKNQSSLLSNTLFNIIYSGLNVIFPLVTSMYVTRIIGVDGLGKIAFAQSIAAYFVSLSALGIPIYGVREIAKVQNNDNERSKIFSELILINTGATLVSCLIYCVLIFQVQKLSSEIGLSVACGLLIFLNLFNIDWLYRGCEDYKYITIRSIAIKIFSLCCMFIFVHNSDDYIVYAFINTIAVAGNYLFNVFHAKSLVKLTLKKLEIKRHLVPITVLAVSVVLESVYGKIDTTMLGFITSTSHIGLYNYAHKLIMLVITLCTSITAVFMPRLSYLYSNDRDKFQSTLNVGLQALAFFSIPASVAIFFLAPDIITALFGQGFIGAVDTVRIFTPLIIITSFSDILCYQLVVCTGNERKRVPAAIIGVIVNVCLNLWLIPILCEKGAAIASVFSEITTNLFLLMYISKIVKIDVRVKWFSQAFFSSLFMIPVFVLLYMCIENILLRLCVSVILGIVVYVVFNYVFKNNFVNMLIKKISAIGGKR